MRTVPGLILFLALSASGLASAATGWRSERDVLRAAQDVAEAAARSDLSAAFERARGLARPDDAVLLRKLEAGTQEPGGAAAARLSSPTETFFAGCVTRSYLLHRAEGSDLLMLKFRRGAGGWYLSDLHLRRA
jgi:hypothetical protein